MIDLLPYVRMDEREARTVAPRCPWPAYDGAAASGYETLQFSWGGLFDSVVPAEPPWCDTHLVRSTEVGTPGPTLCGIDRTAGASPGWSVGGGLSGPDVPVAACADCAALRDGALPVRGLNSEAFA